MKKNTIIGNIKIYKEYILIAIVIFILFLIIVNSSPLYKGLSEVDSSVFQVMGKGMLENKLIYKDLFDHKGPIIYIINALAILIHNKYGLFVIELVLFYIGTIFIYKTSKIVMSKKTSLFICLLYILASLKCFEGGNFTEEYAITFISIAMYYMTKILYQKDDSKRIYWIIIGATFTINLLIKPTYISIWIAFGIVQLISAIKDKKIKQLIKNIGHIIIGILVILVPIIIYLIVNNDFNDFIEAYINLNMKYSESTVIERAIAFKKIVKKCKYTKFILLIIISNIIILLSQKIINKRTKSYITLFSLLSIILTAWAPNVYGHYLIQLSPCIAIEAIFLIYVIKEIVMKKDIMNYKIIQDIPLNFIYYITILIFLVDCTIPLIKEKGIFSAQMKREEKIINKVMEVSDYIKEDDNILILGNNSYYYLLFNKQPEFKYFFQYPIIKYDEKIKNETEKYIIEKKPKVIIDQKYKSHDVCKGETFEGMYGKRVLEELKRYYKKHDIGIMDYYVLNKEI